MKNLYFYFIAIFAIVISCQKADTCESFFKGTIIDSETELPVSGAKVMIQTDTRGGFSAGDGVVFIDSIVTDMTGSFSVSSNESFKDWFIKAILEGHEDAIKVYDNKPCRTVIEDIEITALAQLHISTEDVPELQYKELHISTWPEIESLDSLRSRTTLGINESATIWLKPYAQALIRYRLQEGENIGGINELPTFAAPREVVEIKIKM